MAKATLNGDVSISETTPRLVTLWETFTYTYKDETKEGKRKWSLWFDTDAHGLSKGDWIEVSGELGTKAVEWTATDGTLKHLVDHIINEPQILKHVAKGRAEAPVVEKVRDLDDERKYGSGIPF